MKSTACFIAAFVWLLKGLQGCLFKPHLIRAHRQILQCFGSVFGSPGVCFGSIALRNKGLGTQGPRKQGCYEPLFGA